MGRTGILIQAEPSAAEVDPPLFPHTLLHQAVEDKDEKSWNTKTQFNFGPWPLKFLLSNEVIQAFPR